MAPCNLVSALVGLLGQIAIADKPCGNAEQSFTCADDEECCGDGTMSPQCITSDQTCCQIGTHATAINADEICCANPGLNSAGYPEFEDAFPCGHGSKCCVVLETGWRPGWRSCVEPGFSCGPHEIDSRCPQEGHNGGCCHTCENNRYCPADGGCYALGQSGCATELCPAPEDAPSPPAPPAPPAQTCNYWMSDQGITCNEDETCCGDGTMMPQCIKSDQTCCTYYHAATALNAGETCCGSGGPGASSHAFGCGSGTVCCEGDFTRQAQCMAECPELTSSTMV